MRHDPAEVDGQQDTAEDDIKRARGRPRLQTTDQTASERRRTQIRLAQRAYRSRKETAMNDLEDQVKKLKDANIEMQEVARDLADCAAQYSSLISKMPELSRHLNKIRSLVKTRKNSTRSDDSASDDVLDRNMHDDPEPLVKSEESKGCHSPAMKLRSQAQSLLTAAQPADYANHENHNYSAYQDQDGSGYEVIAVPTSDNASFVPNKIDLGTNFLQGISWAEQTSSSTFQLPHPGSCPSSTFGKRLHRRAKAKAVALFDPTTWPTSSTLHTFGLSCFFESAEDVQRRINEDLQTSTNEAMYNMQFPYYANGGSAQQYVSRNQVTGSTNPYTGGESYRPMVPEATTSELRRRLLDLCRTMRVPSTRSVVWDCDEVDLYLTQRGVALSSAVEVCDVEINPASFLLAQTNAQSQHGPINITSSVIEDSQHGNEPLDGTGWGNGGPVPPESTTLAGELRKTMRVNVVKMVDDLAARAIYLGRTITFRPVDVNTAFWGAITA